jgi:hypothetical protein
VKRQPRTRRLSGALAARHQLHLTDMMAATATKLLPLLAILDAVQVQANAESVFRARRRKIQLHMAIAYAELRAGRPRHQALSYTFHTLAELVREETHDISHDELKQAAKEVALATLRHAPALISVAHQARLLA